MKTKKRRSATNEPKFPFFQIEWDAFAESYFLDWFFKCAPPENQRYHFAIGEREMSNVMNEIKKAIQRRQRRGKKK